MAIDPSIFKSYDIRGVYPSQINEENMKVIVSSIYNFFTQKIKKENFTICLSYDIRTSTPALYKSTVDTLKNAGANVMDIGLSSTPTFYFAVHHYNFDCGLQITASHNPKEWNGIKFVINSPTGLIKIGKPTGMEDVKNLALSNFTLPSMPRGKIQKVENVYEDEVKNSLSIVGSDNLNKFKIVADPANAMAITYLEALEKLVSMNLVKMNFTLDGTFPVHQPDPIQPENLVDLQKRVIKEQADFGLAPDGDGDRLFIIDEKGNVVSASIITSIIAKEILKKNPGSKVVVDQKYILTTKKIIEENGGELLLSKTGHAYITELMTKSGAVFAGEASAHYYYKETGNAESQTTTILFLLKILTESKKKLSVLAENYEISFESGEINFKVSNVEEILDKLKSEYKDGELSEMDGITITYPNFRFSVRSSNTEPLLRLNVESLDKNKMLEKKDELVNKIKDISK